MTTPKKIAEEKSGNYQSSLNGGGPPIGKRPIYFRFFLLKAFLNIPMNVHITIYMNVHIS